MALRADRTDRERDANDSRGVRGILSRWAYSNHVHASRVCGELFVFDIGGDDCRNDSRRPIRGPDALPMSFSQCSYACRAAIRR